MRTRTREAVGDGFHHDERGIGEIRYSCEASKIVTLTE
jgi:hypothetical protein